MDTEKKQDLMVLTGPTAVGKTELSLRIAELLEGAIVSADSMQVYRSLDIGSAKLAEGDRRGIPHYLLDVLDPEESFSVAAFQELAQKAIETCAAHGRLPILTGGTGFYIQAVLRDVDFSSQIGQTGLRSLLEEECARFGPGRLHDRLRECDPAAADQIHPHNVKRVIRALEFYLSGGSRISDHNRLQRERSSPYCYRYFVLTDERSRLYERIDRRVDEMAAMGLEEEVRALYDRGLTENHTSMKGIGYKEWFPYFRGEQSREETIRIIKRDTRHFAKRQLTWFQREEDVIWVDRRRFASEDQIIEFILQKWKERETCGQNRKKY